MQKAELEAVQEGQTAGMLAWTGGGVGDGQAGESVYWS